MGTMLSRIINRVILWYNQIWMITNYSHNELTDIQTIREETGSTDQTSTQNKSNETKENLEIFSLIWCDIKVNSAIDSRHTQIKLRQIINFLIMFDNIRDCLQYINEKQNEKVVLIVSAQYGVQLLPLIHKLNQIVAIYVYCDHKEIHEQWANTFEKVQAVVTTSDEFLQEISKNQQIQIKIDTKMIPISIFRIDENEQTHKNLAEENGNFMWFQLIIYVLINMINVTKSNDEINKICSEQGVDIDVNNREPFYQLLRRISDEEDMKRSIPELADLCRQQYSDNDSQLKVVNEFQREYESELSIWWYTRDSFIYRILNKALRQQNIDILFLFRFLIHDIYILLQEQQKYFDEDIILLYRGQWLPQTEFEYLKNSNGQYISMNSFLSTTKNRQLALIYAGSDDNKRNLISVLFEITANTRRTDLKPFADISYMSQFGAGESEILFMLGSVFNIKDVYFNTTDEIWVIELELSDTNDGQLKDVYLSLKNEIGEEVSLSSLGHVLAQMSDNDRAIQCYHRALKQLPAGHAYIQRCYYELAEILSAKHDYNQALFYYEQALKLELNSISSPYLIGDIYQGIGLMYFDRVDYDNALLYYRKALESFLSVSDSDNLCTANANGIHFDSSLTACGSDHLRTANAYGNIANLYHKQKKYDLAKKCYSECLRIAKILLPENHPYITSTLKNLGTMKMNQGDHKSALEVYKECLKLELMTLPSDHPSHGNSHVNIGDAYAHLGDHSSAVQSYLTAKSIYKKSLPLSDPKFAQISWRIASLTNNN